MAKHIKRFDTSTDYINYVSDSSFEAPLVSTCDEMNNYFDTPIISYSGLPEGNNTAGVIKISHPKNMGFYVYIMNEHEILDTEWIYGGVSKSNDSNIKKDNIILGEQDRTSNTPFTYIDTIPYIPGAYYGFHVVSLDGNEEPWNIGISNSNTNFMQCKNFYYDYLNENNLIDRSNYGVPPYSINGYPNNYTGPTIEVTVSEDNTYTNGYQYYQINGETIKVGDKVQLPISKGYKVFPGETIYLYEISPK